MRNSLLTLWDLVKESVTPAAPMPTSRSRGRGRREAETRKPAQAKAKAPRAVTPAQAPGALSMQERYVQITKEMLQLHGVRVRRWRKSMSGVAWQLQYQDGRVSKLIEAPRPKGPMSAAVFLHEIGHHAIGFNVYKPRCLEEYHAWVFAIEQMEALGLNVTDAVRKRMHLSLRYAVQKAQRRGIRSIPPELTAFTQPWRGSSAERRKKAG